MATVIVDFGSLIIFPKKQLKDIEYLTKVKMVSGLRLANVYICAAPMLIQ